MINIEVAYALPDKQWLVALKVPVGTTALEAIKLSNILQLCPEIDLSQLKVGIFSKFIALDTVLQDHDRIEIYRPLIIDPMLKRIIRAKKD